MSEYDTLTSPLLQGIITLVVFTDRMETAVGNGRGDLMGEVQTATIQTDVPVRLLTEMQTLVEAGWFRDLDELMLNALRRFVESHRAELMERFIREDVEWGLHGDE
jgi:hypothetical protein